MEFKINKKEPAQIRKFEQEKYDLALKFAKEIYKEFGTLLKGIILFGSRARKETSIKGDIDILIIVDDVTNEIDPVFVDTYRIITEKTVRKVSDRLHVITLKFSTFWEYVRNSDPIAVNLLRDGVALLDSGFFSPLQTLLGQGRIRPTAESVHSYFAKSPATLHNSKWHILQATVDLYWAVMDAAHAGLMHIGEVPPSPKHVPDLMEKNMLSKNIVNKRDIDVVKEFYKIQKMITYREIKEISGEQYDIYYKEAYDFVEKIKAFLEKKYK